MQVKLPSRGFTITKPAKKHLAVVYLVSVVHLLQRSEICCNLTPYKGLIPRLSCAPDVMSCSRKARGYCMWEHASLEWGYIVLLHLRILQLLFSYIQRPSQPMNQDLLLHKQSESHIWKKAGLHVMLCKITQFSQHQASSALLEWPGGGDCMPCYAGNAIGWP